MTKTSTPAVAAANPITDALVKKWNKSGVAAEVTLWKGEGTPAFSGVIVANDMGDEFAAILLPGDDAVIYVRNDGGSPLFVPRRQMGKFAEVRTVNLTGRRKAPAKKAEVKKDVPPVVELPSRLTGKDILDAEASGIVGTIVVRAKASTPALTGNAKEDWDGRQYAEVFAADGPRGIQNWIVKIDGVWVTGKPSRKATAYKVDFRDVVIPQTGAPAALKALGWEKVRITKAVVTASYGTQDEGRQVVTITKHSDSQVTVKYVVAVGDDVKTVVRSYKRVNYEQITNAADALLAKML